MSLFEVPPRNWKNLSELLEMQHGQFFNARARLFRTIRAEGNERFDSASHLEAQLRHADWVFAEPIQQFIREIAAQPDQWPDFKRYPAGMLPLFEARLWIVYTWVGDHFILGKRTLLPFPAGSAPALFTWLLDTWWNEHGRRLGAEHLIGDHLHDEAMVGDSDAWDEKPRRRRRSAGGPLVVESTAGRKAGEQPHSWETLARWLDSEADAFRKFPQALDVLRQQGASFLDLEAVSDALRAVEKQHHEAIEPALDEWISRHSAGSHARARRWPEEMEAALGATVALRLKTVAKWARTHVLEGECLIEYPAVSLRKLLRWLLRDWWHYQGRHFAAARLQVMWVEENARTRRNPGH